MRFASVIHEHRELAVAIDGELAVPLTGISELGAATPTTVLRDPPLDYGASFPLAQATLRPVVPQPPKIFCVGLNYREHVAEMADLGRTEFTYPALFTKFAASLIGPYDEIPCPPETEFLDYEAELTVVIGRPARRLTPERALDCVAGYTLGNDVSMRDYQNFTSQFLPGKAWDRCTPVGPWLVTPDELGDVQQLGIRSYVNGELRQDSSTAQMIFDVATVIAKISEFTQLTPGDLILTGTPSGVGFARNPKVSLAPGDEVVVEIDRIGRIANTVVAEHVKRDED